jgi:hypothetical protein
MGAIAERGGMQKQFLGMLSVTVLLVGCGVATKLCGYFEFFTLGAGPGGEASLEENFTFQDYQCNANCTATTIAYLEAVKLYDTETGEVLAPSSIGIMSEGTTVNGTPALNGWWINNPEYNTQLATYSGYYGRQEGDGTPQGAFDASYITTGTNVGTNRSAMIHMYPGELPANSWYMAIDAPVCINGSSACNNQILGYEYWLLPVDASGNAGAPFYETGVDWNVSAMACAVQQWNTNAPSTVVFPNFSVLGGASNTCPKGN